MSALVLEELPSCAALAAIEPEWRALWDRCPDATPFLRPEWILPWCRHLGPERLAAVTMRAEGRLVGLAPLFAWEDRGARVASLLGAAVSDHLDVVFEHAHAEACADAHAAYLAAGPWDRCDLEPLRASSPLLAMPAPAGFRDARADGDVCPVLPLARGIAAVVPASMRGNLRRARARAAQRGRLDLFTSGPARRAEILDALCTLHGVRWGRAGERGMLADRAVQAFHRDASAGIEAEGALRLHAAALDGRIIAALYAFSYRGVHSLYLHGYDPDLAPLSPGALLIAHAVEAAAREGAREVDFLRGRERYKSLWGADLGRATYRRTLTREAST